MTDLLLALLIKLPLALAVFLVIAYAGTVSRRIAGVLLTFPILNGIAIIASPQPVVVADAIYPLVIFNCALFALVISFPHVLPPMPAMPRTARLFARVIVWSIAWFAGAYLVTDLRAAIPGAGVLLAASAVFATLFVFFCWSRSTPPDVARMEQSEMRGRSRISLRLIRATGFITFWANRTGAGRIAFFILAYACLFFAARAALDEKWVGMASALPLPGFFAVATLIDDAEHTGTPNTLLAIRDTVFLGPLLVIPFNWLFSHAMLTLPPAAFAPRYALLFAMWLIAALAVVFLVPRVAAYFDRRS